MSCGEAREKLPLYVGGDLDPEVLDAVRGHLDACGECARRTAEAVRARRELVAALRARETGHGRPALWSGIRAALRAEGLVHEARSPAPLPAAPVRATRPRWVWALLPAVAAAVVLATLQVSSFLARGPRVERTPELAGPAPMDGSAELVSLPPEPAGDSLAAPAGGLQRVDPRESVLRPLIYRGPARRGEGAAPSPYDISLTGLNGYK